MSNFHRKICDRCWDAVDRAKEAAQNRSKDSRQGEALAYYSVFSLGPIVLIAIAVAGPDRTSRFVDNNIFGDAGTNAVYARPRWRREPPPSKG